MCHSSSGIAYPGVREEGTTRLRSCLLLAGLLEVTDENLTPHSPNSAAVLWDLVGDQAILLSAAASFFLSQDGWTIRLHPTFRSVLHCFRAEILRGRDLGHISTRADHLSDNHEVGRWRSQSCNGKMSYSTRCLYLGSNCYSAPPYVRKLLEQ